MDLPLDDDDVVPWTLDEHMSQGQIALEAIAHTDGFQGTPRVCHHFWAESANDEEFDTKISGERFRHLIPEFGRMGLTFESDRLEAWEAVLPTSDWLQDRIPALYSLVKPSGLAGYQGWTCEPSGVQPIGACEFTVINNTNARKSENAQTH